MATVTGKTDGTNVFDEERAWLSRRLATHAHEVWARWMHHVFSYTAEWQSEVLYNRDGSLIIPPLQVARWARQMSTPFEALPEHEQKSDYEIAHEYLQIFEEYQEARTLRDSPPVEVAAKSRCMWCNRPLDYGEHFMSQPFDLTLCESCFKKRATIKG